MAREGSTIVSVQPHSATLSTTSLPFSCSSCHLSPKEIAQTRPRSFSGPEPRLSKCGGCGVLRFCSKVSVLFLTAFLLADRLPVSRNVKATAGRSIKPSAVGWRPSKGPTRAPRRQRARRASSSGCPVRPCGLSRDWLSVEGRRRRLLLGSVLSTQRVRSGDLAS